MNKLLDKGTVKESYFSYYYLSFYYSVGYFFCKKNNRVPEPNEFNKNEMCLSVA